MRPSWQSTVVALGFIAFAGLTVYVAATSNNGTNFSTIWAGVGTVIGVLTGAIPAYFFKQQADAQTKKATAFAGLLPPATYTELTTAHPELAL
jgi:hypothetical protein